jgi:hypothetical protein
MVKKNKSGTVYLGETGLCSESEKSFWRKIVFKRNNRTSAQTGQRFFIFKIPGTGYI